MNVAESLADAAPRPFWTDRPDRPEPLPPLTGAENTQLAVVGGGYSGLWTALLAKERDPSADVVLLESGLCGQAASGRNGGFCAASLTHGVDHGADRFPDEIAELERLGRANLAEIEQTITRYGIDCDLQRSGELTVATEQYQLPWLAEMDELSRSLGGQSQLLDAAQVRAQVDSPTYLGAWWNRDGVAMLDPARLAWGLRRACLELGVRIFEGTPVLGILHETRGLALRTPAGVVNARQVALATGAFPAPGGQHLLRRMRHYLIPVYDYALMTEPLSAAQRDSIGWRERQGLADSANQFHYYRMTEDGRILFGGYDAVYYFGNRISPELEQRPATFQTLAGHFFTTFPQLEGVRFTHRWGGVIDTCTRFCAFFGTAYDGRLAYAAGYTGLGVGATRFGAQVMLDKLGGLDTERTRLRFTQTKPRPLPGEPLRSIGINLTRRALARADANQGRRGMWLRTLDKLGLGFDS